MDYMREAVILFIFCLVWTFIATPTVANAVHEMQWTNKPRGGEDYVARARVARCGVYSMCASIPFGSHIEYPLNWLAVILVAPTIFFVSWSLLKKVGS
jgi:ABC-type Co2+ transport system permease subunit